MKNTARLQLFFIIFFVADSMITTKIIGRAAVGYEQKTRTTFLTTEQKSQVATNTLIKYFEQMIDKNILGVAGLKRLAESPTIINPLLPEQYHTSDLVDTFKAQLDTLLEKGKGWFDLATIKTWAQAKIQELEHRERMRQRVHEETREVHIPMGFVEIPAGKYKDTITHEEFDIQPGTEIQETPVTQYQWTQVMGDNPSHFIDGLDSEEVLITGKKIKLRPDAPVENISYNQVQEFIKKLNEQDKTYIYALPSVQEYQAIMQSALGSNWLEQLQHVKTYGDTEKTCTVTSGDYMLTPNKQRVFGLVGHVWQWTRDRVDLGGEPHGLFEQIWQWIRKRKTVGPKQRSINDAHLVFGSSYVTRESIAAINELLRPIWYSGNIDKNIGVRLVRNTKREAHERIENHYPHDVLSWNEKDAEYDRVWHWNKKLGNVLSTSDEFAWMIEHKSDYPQEAQHTIDVLLQKVPAGKDPIVYITRLTELDLYFTDIRDLVPLSDLINLTLLRLSGNRIDDLAPLANLTGLTTLYLAFEKNLRDLTPLANLTGLTILDLGENYHIEDLTPLSNLTRLTILLLRHNQIKDLTPLAGLTNLTRLELCYNHIKDLAPLASLANLLTMELELMHNPVEDFTPLASFRSLSLSIDRNQLNKLGNSNNAQQVLPYAIVRIWEY